MRLSFINIRQWLLISLLIRLIVMPITMHGDLLHIARWPNFLAHGEWDAFGIAARHGVNYYAPLLLVFLAVFEKIFMSLLPGFEGFTRLLCSSKPPSMIFSSDHLFQSLFILKLPYIFFDLLIIWACFKMLNSAAEKKFFIIFWAVNPVIIYSTFMMGQCSIMATFFVVMACYLALQDGQGKYACLSIASGTLFKVFPIIFLPLVICVSSRSLKDLIKCSLYGVLPIIVFYGFFYYISGDAVFKVFYVAERYSQSSTKILDVLIRMIQVSIYSLICYHIVIVRRNEYDYPLLFQYFLAIFLTVYLGFHYYSFHHLSWFIPFLILYIQQHPKLKSIFFFFMIVILLGTLKGRTTCLGLLAPLNPHFFLSIPALKDIVGFIFGFYVYYTVTDIIFKGIIIFFIGSILKELFFTDSMPVERGLPRRSFNFES